MLANRTAAQIGQLPRSSPPPLEVTVDSWPDPDRVDPDRVDPDPVGPRVGGKEASRCIPRGIFSPFVPLTDGTANPDYSQTVGCVKRTP